LLHLSVIGPTVVFISVDAWLEFATLGRSGNR